MITFYLPIIGCSLLVISSLYFGLWLRRHPLKKNAEIATRIMHFFVIFTWMAPMGAGLTMLTEYDKLLDIPLLPFPIILEAAGALMILIGGGFFLVSIAVLLDSGEGLPAFELSKKLAARNIYKHTRNPMSLGVYLICVGLSLLGGSTFFVLYSLAIFIPAHVFFLKYFEERELEIRFGEDYKEYKQKVPFLIPDFCGITRNIYSGRICTPTFANNYGQYLEK